MQSEEPRTNAENPSNRVLPFWLIALGLGLLAGTVSAFCGELTSQALHREPDYPASFTSLSSSERAVARAVVRYNTRVAVETNKAAAAFGLLGITLGVAMGLAGGLAGPSRRVSLKGALGGGVLGGLAGAGLSMALVPLFFQLSDSGIISLPLLLGTHAAIFAGVAAVGSGAMAWEWGDRNGNYQMRARRRRGSGRCDPGRRGDQYRRFRNHAHG